MLGNLIKNEWSKLYFDLYIIDPHKCIRIEEVALIEFSVFLSVCLCLCFNTLFLLRF